LVLSIALLPSPSEPSVIAFGAAIGAFFGNSLARWTGADRDGQTHAAINGSYNGIAMALFVYIAANSLAAVAS
jgi:hypothetical protein